MLGKLVLYGMRRRRERREADDRAAELQRRIQLQLGQIVGAPEPAARESRKRAAARVAWRGRKILAPLVGLLALWAAAAAVAGGNTPAGGVLAVWALLAGVWWTARRRQLRRAEERWYAAVVWAGSGAWLAAAPLVGVASSAPVLWLVGGLAAVPWWVHHWPRPRPPDPAPVEADDLPARWARNVAASSRALPGAVLSNYAAAEHYDEWDIETVPGAQGQTLDSAVAKLPQIATGLREPQERLLLEARPGGDPSVHRLKRLRHSPVEEIQYFTEPRYRDGRVLLGSHVDRIGDAVWRVYTQNSMWGGFMGGGTGTGKSRLLEMIALTLRWEWQQRGIPTAIIYLDGQNGASSPVLWEHATWSGGPDDVSTVLDALDAAASTRQAWNRLHGLTGFTPGYRPDGAEEGLTGLLVIADEFHALCPNKQVATRFARVSREQRKLGHALLAADQATDLDTFGTLDVLRATLLDGNGMAFRISSQTQGSLIPGLAINPAQLPAIPGYGYKIAAPKSGERTTAFRADFLPADTDREEQVIPDGVRTVESWFAATEDAPVDAMTRRALGPAFEQRAERKALALEVDRAMVDGRELPAIEAPDVADSRVESGPDSGVWAALASLGGGQRAVEGKKRPARERIVELLRERGETTRQELLAELGVSGSAVTQALQRLQADGQVSRVRDGVYDLAERARVVA